MAAQLPWSLYQGFWARFKWLPGIFSLCSRVDAGSAGLGRLNRALVPASIFRALHGTTKETAMNRILPTLLCVLALAAPAAAQSVRVSTPRTVQVRSVQVSPMRTTTRTTTRATTTRTTTRANVTRTNVTRVNVAQPRRVTVRPSRTVVTPPPVQVRRAPARPTPAPAPTGVGTLSCSATENGSSAVAHVTVRSAGQEVYSGRCDGLSGRMPAGSYDATVRLSGLVDSPTIYTRVQVRAGGAGQIAANFETGRLQVDVMHNGRRIPGRATILQNGLVVGTIGSGVYSRLSAGTYTVRVEVAAGYSDASGSRDYQVNVTANSARRIRATF